MTTVGIVGGGAAGFFAAIEAARCGAKVTIFESSAKVSRSVFHSFVFIIFFSHFIHFQVLQKVVISGGGRCNVTHDASLEVLLAGYPRGHQFLRPAFEQFGAADTRTWFAARGVKTTVESDGRVFPISDRSQSVAFCLESAAAKEGVVVKRSSKVGLCFDSGSAVTSRAEVLTLLQVTDVRRGAQNRHFEVTVKESKPGSLGNAKPATTTDYHLQKIILACGVSSNSLSWAEKMGHRIIPAVPSLFSFRCTDARISGLAGVSLNKVTLTLHVGQSIFTETGPIIITHTGLSGPAVLRLSSFAAREMHAANYKATLLVDWAGRDAVSIRRDIEAIITSSPGKIVSNDAPAYVPRRLWEALVASVGCEGLRWAQATEDTISKLVGQVQHSTLQIDGRSPYVEEFVTAGGVSMIVVITIILFKFSAAPSLSNDLSISLSFFLVSFFHFWFLLFFLLVAYLAGAHTPGFAGRH